MKQFVMWTYSLLLVMGIAGYVVLTYLLPEYNFRWYVAIPTLFCVTEMGVSLLPTLTEGKNQAKTANTFLMVKIVKFLLAIVLCLVYFRVVGEQKICFTIVFLVFYAMTLMTETIFVSQFLKTRNA